MSVAEHRLQTLYAPALVYDIRAQFRHKGVQCTTGADHRLCIAHGELLRVLPLNDACDSRCRQLKLEAKRPSGTRPSQESKCDSTRDDAAQGDCKQVVRMWDAVEAAARPSMPTAEATGTIQVERLDHV